jgi:superfamily II DNA or RNA helicase
MSVRILRSALSEDKVAFIRQMLIMYPQTAPVYNKTNFYSTTEEKDPIIFYIVKKDSKGVEYVWLPFAFGNIIAGKIVNLEKTYQNHNFDFKSSLYENQVEVINEALEHLNKYCTTNLYLTTGYGKSRCATFLATKIKLVTLVIIHTTALIEQWVKEFADNTTAKVWIVDVASKLEIPKEFDVIIALDGRITNLPDEILDQIGLVIIDEIDRQLTRGRILPFLSTQPKYMISLTATPDLRSDGMDAMAHALTGNHSIVRQIIKNITMFKINTYVNPPVEKTQRGTDWTKLNRHLSRDIDRNNIIIKLAIQNYHHKILIVAEYQEHTTFLYEQFKNLGKSCDYLTGDKDTYEDSQILVGTKKKLGIGFDDINSAKNSNGIRINVLILVSTIKDESLLTQVLGRIRDQNPIIFYLIDDNPTVKRHWTSCNKWLKSRGLGYIDWKQPIEKLIVDKEGKILEKAPEVVKPEVIESEKPKLKLNIVK